MTWLPLLWILTGCAPSVCDWTADWASRCDVAWTDADDQSCTDTLRVCTHQEKQRLEAFWLCLDKRKYFQCDPVDTGLTGAPPAAAEDLLACRDHLDGVSLSCSSAIGLEGGTFAGLSEPTETP